MIIIIDAPAFFFDPCSALQGALLAAAGKAGLAPLRDQHRRLAEVPFSSDTKVMAVTVPGPCTGNKPQSYVKVLHARSGGKGAWWLC